ncbi:MAG: glycosyltransferase family 2 protein [Cyanosarcina radialis HA8281-LM2]|jgi:glycosyltransferase involved in cell wall biosynthesis|nr:glycosyltransferase family 2 protein [Cyanosarcina radialis HA8281-LM2]
MSLPSISLVIPVHNGGEHFRKCLSSVQQFVPSDTEIIIVVDGGTDDSLQVAQTFARSSGAKVLHSSTASGPARARNLGARSACGDILFFIDADVTLHPDTCAQIATIFQHQPDLAALIGSYDDAPGSPNFLSQYKNLFHHYTHQTASETASTFWGACGAIRRDIFLKIDGFDESYRYPSVEDIELGYRLKQGGYRIQLCKTVQVKHLKHWRLISLLKAEIFYRAIPWTELLWRDRQFINDLNLKVSTRTSILLTDLLLIAVIASWWTTKVIIVAGVIGLILLVINRSVYQFFWQQRGLWFACRTVPWHWLYFFYSGLAFGIGTLRYQLIGKPRVVKSNSQLPIHNSQLL